MKSQTPTHPLANTRAPRFNGVQLELRPSSFVIYDADQPANHGVELLYNQLDGLRAALDLVEKHLRGETVADALPPRDQAMILTLHTTGFADSLRPMVHVAKARSSTGPGLLELRGDAWLKASRGIMQGQPRDATYTAKTHGPDFVVVDEDAHPADHALALAFAQLAQGKEPTE